ncbi:MAG: hypothetical protein IKA22_02095 [Lentisphaeria bacterium]|nr:hypothetical protein [Lentisphaeria bacterium]
MKHFIFLTVLSFISIASATVYEIGAANFKLYKHSNPPQKSFGLNGKNIQIKTPGSSIFTAWAGHRIQPSSNFISFKIKSLQSAKAGFKTHIQMIAYHVDRNDQCKGRAKDKFFELKNFANSAENEFHLPLTINSEDLRCQQCSRLVNHATFLFYFENGNDGGIEISPFTLRTAFNITIEKARDTKSPYISNILSPDFKPYETKELPTVSRFTDDVLVMSQKANMMQTQYKSFLPILDLWQKKDYQNAILQAEKIADKNTFCSIFLYLFYSRGDENFQVNYTRAAKYFSNLIGSYFGREPGFRFYLEEYKNIWKSYRLIPTYTNEKVTIKAWSADGTQMDEIVPLRGKYPLKNCYEEKMHNIGGIAARTLYLIEREQTALRTIREHARKLGSAEALINDYAPYIEHRKSLAEEVTNKPSDVEFKNLKKAAELGFIPAKLKLARVLVTKNFAPGGFDFVTARKLLKESIAELEKYSKTPCTHAAEDLQYARDLLALIPLPAAPTAELVQKYNALQREKRINLYFHEFKLNIISEMISARNDDPDAIFQQALKLPNAQYKKKNEMIRSAAEKGSHNAIRLCLQQIYNSSHREHWYFLILAGKYKVPYNGSQINYFNEAYQFLRKMRYMVPIPEYIKALSVLAPYHEKANAEYKIFSRKLEFDITVSDKNSVSAAAINQNNMQSIKIKAQVSDKKRHIIIKNKSKEKIKGEFFLFTQSQQRSNLDISCEFKDEHGRMQKTYPGNSTLSKYIPDELKIFIAPRTSPLDLDIRFMLY